MATNPGRRSKGQIFEVAAQAARLVLRRNESAHPQLQLWNRAAAAGMATRQRSPPPLFGHLGAIAQRSLRTSPVWGWERCGMFLGDE